MTCADTPVWTGTVEATGDGEYVTAPVTLTQPGYYTYREWIVESDLVAGVETACAEVAETTVVRGAAGDHDPDQRAGDGSGRRDHGLRGRVSGLGKLGATVNVELWGPFPTREAIRCEGTPFWTGTLPVTGDGTYTTAPVTLAQAGYYTYRESIAATEAYEAVITACGEVSRDDDREGGAEGQHRRVGRRGQARRRDLRPADGQRASARRRRRSRSRSTARTRRARTSTARARRTGRARSRSPATGRTTRRRRPSAAPGSTRSASGSSARRPSPAFQGECAVEAETSLAAPLILGGRGDTRRARQRGAGRDAPERASGSSRLGIDAPVSPSASTRAAGALGIPTRHQAASAGGATARRPATTRAPS